jgi:hypothetical protein
MKQEFGARLLILALILWFLYLLFMFFLIPFMIAAVEEGERRRREALSRSSDFEEYKRRIEEIERREKEGCLSLVVSCLDIVKYVAVILFVLSLMLIGGCFGK